MLQFYSPMFTYNKIIKGTDTGVRVAACRRLGKHKYAFNAMPRCENKNLKCWTLFVKMLGARRSARQCEVKK